MRGAIEADNWDVYFESKSDFDRAYSTAYAIHRSWRAKLSRR